MNVNDKEFAMLDEVVGSIYNRGIKDGSFDVKMRVEGAYEKGLEDAWECARKILDAVVPYDYWDIGSGHHISYAIKRYSASEAMQKIKEYEERQKKIEKITEYEYKQKKERCKTCEYYEGYSCYDCIKGIKDCFEPKQTDKLKVGDEIIANDHKQVITAIINENLIFTVNQNGQYGSFEIGEIQNVTGRHFPQIAEVLEQLRGEEE